MVGRRHAGMQLFQQPAIQASGDAKIPFVGVVHEIVSHTLGRENLLSVCWLERKEGVIR